MFSTTRLGLTCNEVIVIVVVVVTLTLMTSRLADAADSLDVDRHWRGRRGGRAGVTWYGDVTLYRHNSVLQRDEPTKLEEVYIIIIIIIIIVIISVHRRLHGIQESLADAKVNARQQCVYEGP